MDLAQKFEGVAGETIIPVTELGLNIKDRFLRAKWLNTWLDPIVVLTIRDAGVTPAQIFLWHKDLFDTISPKFV